VLEKTKKWGQPLSELCYITAGIQTGCDKLSKSQIEKFKIDGRIGDGIFTLAQHEVDALFLDD